jgi:periplasmic copper chaperone A
MKKFSKILLVLLSAGLGGTLAFAHEFKAGQIVIGHPFARATAPAQPAGGGYLTLNNQGTTPDRLVSVRADVSSVVELHSMAMEGDIMRMRQVDAVDLPVGQKVELKPGGLHIMFIGLKAPFKAGDTFPVTLKFEKAGEVTVQVVVEATGAAPASAVHKH